MIEIKNVNFRYASKINNIEDISLTIKDGECIVITGESGCGKSTLIVIGDKVKTESGCTQSIKFIGGSNLHATTNQKSRRCVILRGF